jgi:succinoglycan biosynthesis protein ExoM
MSNPVPLRVGLAICTYNRPIELDRLIRTAADFMQPKIIDSTFHVVVVDDSSDGNARPIVDSLRQDLSVRIEYTNTASRSISTARNTAIVCASADTDYFACIDDDCLPEAGWIDHLVHAAEQTHAEIIIGHRQFVAPAEAGGWLRDEPFLDENERYADLSEPEHGNVANMLINSAWLRTSGVRFRDALGRLGGEDMAFLSDAKESGARLRFSAKSVVNEPYGAGRVSLRYHLWRQMWLGNNEAAINHNTHGLSRPRLALRGARRVARGATHPVRRLVSRQSAQWRWGLATVLRGLGLIAGTLGVHLEHRS